MSPPKVNSEISIGNIVSWALVVVGFIAGYVKLQGAVERSVADLLEVKKSAAVDENRLHNHETAEMERIADMKTDVAVLKTDVRAIRSSLDSIERKLDNLNK